MRHVYSFPMLKSLAEDTATNSSERFYCDAAGFEDFPYVFELANDTDK